MRALLRASRRRRDELVKSCSRLESTSKLITNAMSLGRRISARKLAPTSFSISSTLCWLPLASIRMPRVRGRSDSAAKYLMVSGLPSSRSWKSLLARLGISPPFLSLTLKKSWTTLTLTFRVLTDWSRSSVWLSWFWLSLSGVPARRGSAWPRPGSRKGGWLRSRQSPKWAQQTPATCGLSASRYSPALFVSLFHQG